MSRIVTKKARGPSQIEKDSWICMCGLSGNQPYCDASHKKTMDEGDETYFYSDEGRLKVEEIRVSGGACKCGHGGDCGNCSNHTSKSNT